MMCQGHGLMCGGMHSSCCGGRHRLLRLILGLVILGVVFSAGVKLGELKAVISEGLYGSYMFPGHIMWRGSNGQYAYPQGWGMMGGRDESDYSPKATSTPR